MSLFVANNKCLCCTDCEKGFYEKCKLNSDCQSDVLACDAWAGQGIPITKTCLGVVGTKCNSASGCANNITCINYSCACDVN